MAVYAIKYVYGVSSEALNEVRPIHRAWLEELLNKGVLLASGPMVDTSEALLIFQASDPQDLAELLDQDPFDIAGFIETRVIQQWNPVFGPFTS